MAQAKAEADSPAVVEVAREQAALVAAAAVVVDAEREARDLAARLGWERVQLKARWVAEREAREKAERDAIERILREVLLRK